MLDLGSYLLTRAWQWIADQGLSLAILLVLALLVPRVGRFAQRWLARGVEETTDADESKTRLALTGVSVYIFQLIAFFVLLIFFLQVLGFSLAGAAIPATVVSAAIGFGAQSIIADFLAGFFILTEKQFGVGDWVRFEGNGIEVEGTVIQVTMRSTRIRTLAQETVIIPNSTARVCINSSNYWSRAVVVIPVPLLGSSDTQEAIDRSEAATRRALRRPDVAKELIGELDVHPAVNINPPATVGMPWTMDMRFMIQVEAGMQWLVERAIRTEILDEFWNEYGSATTITGDVKDRVDTVTTGALAGMPLIDIPLSTPHDSAGDREASVPAGYADEEGRDPAVVDRGPQGDEPEDTVDEQTPAGGMFRHDTPTSRWKRFASAGGRVRPSTTYLFGTLFLLIVLKVLTVDAGEDGPSGILAPPAPGVTSTPATEPAPLPENTPAPTPTTAPLSPQQTSPTTPAPTPELTGTPTADTPEGVAGEVDATGNPDAPEAPAEPQPTPLQPQVTPDSGQ
ncbi:MAG: mechanosensitive ion channel family protein [Corynebacterium humireducens]|jgi:small conductance mechanosensitive channel|uniref:Mechanosensitive ion channel family protein n=1 Tax=Corynebacterium humireducens TaxID=1223514 RepID=A0A7X6PNH4_9CORY|nr:mechanosensitive ion channel family protein [Corynebacterium humireducens]